MDKSSMPAAVMLADDALAFLNPPNKAMQLIIPAAILCILALVYSSKPCS